jgi:ABC-type dipeptide/oligopeptide/nickel transport system permease component
MIKYVLKRIGLMVGTFFVIVTICFFLIKLLPLPVIGGAGKDVELILLRRKAFGYDKPLIIQYLIFLRRAFLLGDWGVGEQMYVGQEVKEVFFSKLPATLTVNFYSLVVGIPFGLALGIFAALKKDKWQDIAISIIVMLFVSVPSYIYAFLVQYIFSYKLGWLPFQIEASTNWLSPSMFVSMVPAFISLSFGTIASLARITRAELGEVLTGDYMLLARAKGLSRGQATLRHALKNAMVAIFPIIIGEFVSILSGSLIIERIFGIPGVGKLLLSAISVRDYNFYMLLTCFYTFIGLFAGLAVDLSYGFIDPRIRLAGE